MALMVGIMSWVIEDCGRQKKNIVRRCIADTEWVWTDAVCSVCLTNITLLTGEYIYNSFVAADDNRDGNSTEFRGESNK